MYSWILWTLFTLIHNIHRILYRMWMRILSFQRHGLFDNSQLWSKIPEHVGFIFHELELKKIIENRNIERILKEFIHSGTLLSLYDRHGKRYLLSNTTAAQRRNPKDNRDN
jgi:hypothetical protein